MVQNRDKIGVSTIVGGDGGRGHGGGLDVSPLPPKHYSPIYCDSSNIVAVSRGGAATRSSGGKYMVKIGKIGLGGRAGGVGADKRVGR